MKQNLAMKILAALVAIAVRGGAAVAEAQVGIQLVLPCSPSKEVEDQAVRAGYDEKLIGLFEDGDLFVVYRRPDGRFVVGFARPDGLTCAIGAGKGLEGRSIEKPSKGS